MGKDAARQTADTAGHNGPITSGSGNVTTGGFPAARMGDTFVCKKHGPGVISEGSKTVTINGMPAARKGDKVVCGKKSLPPTKGPEPPEYHYVTIAKNTNEDGSVKNQNGSDKFKLYTGYAVSALTDNDGDDQYDTSNLKAEIIDFQLSHPMGDSGANFNFGGVVGKVEMNAGTISNDKQLSGTYGVKATGVSINTGGSSGKENSGDYKDVKIEGTLGTAEAKASGTLINDEDEHQGGAAFELGAEAAAAKGELSSALESKYLKQKSSLAVSAGSVGGGVKGGVWWDTDNLMFRVKLAGKLALVVGIDWEEDIQIGPFTETPWPVLLGLAISTSGVILTGKTNVIIGG
ncbi:hypothetical protein FNO19_22490 [Salmonella enterica subsp. salamae]|nr:hypothetical protein [Salmonella enterica subsp. salamae]SQH41412.1 sugar-binding protein [Salmonella enterica]